MCKAIIGAGISMFIIIIIIIIIIIYLQHVAHGRRELGEVDAALRLFAFHLQLNLLVLSLLVQHGGGCHRGLPVLSHLLQHSAYFHCARRVQLHRLDDCCVFLCREHSV